MLQLWASFYDVVEETGTWPSQLQLAPVALVPKEIGKVGPLEQRPLTLMDVAYRVWTGARLHHLNELQNAWIDVHVHGARKNHCTEDF